MLTVPDCTLHTANFPGISITATSSGTATVTLTDMTLRCAIQNSTSACYFTAATASGVASNANRSLSFPGGVMSSVTPTSDAAGICPSSMTFGWTFTQLVQGGSNLPVTITTA